MCIQCGTLLPIAAEPGHAAAHNNGLTVLVFKTGNRRVATW